MGDVAFIALGSNLGRREAFLRQGRESIERLPGCRLLAASTVEETAPLGGLAQPPYLNQMIAVETELPAATLLAELQRIEREAGRSRSERWASRTLDLDIVLFDELEIDEPGLRVPHPALAQRDFWRRELAELRALL
jgi:2-amino-4-hydroxy-6-hydroxymethyldihydropteridine diphosphokinase